MNRKFISELGGFKDLLHSQEQRRAIIPLLSNVYKFVELPTSRRQYHISECKLFTFARMQYSLDFLFCYNELAKFSILISTTKLLIGNTLPIILILKQYVWDLNLKNTRDKNINLSLQNSSIFLRKLLRLFKWKFE